MSRVRSLVGGLIALCTLIGVTQVADAAVGMGVRAGTLGYDVDFDVSLVPTLSLRLAYNGLNYNHSVNDTGVRYDGKLKISSFSTLLDWHLLPGGFRLSAGAVASGPKIDVVGTPSGSGTYQIGDNTYTAAQVGSLQGQIKIGNSVAPYVGVGWGNVPKGTLPVTFLFDVGAIYGGTPKVSLMATCNAGIPPAQCTQLQNDVGVEIRKLEDNVSAIKWYPVVSIGIGIRF
jgi:hypothetical protein